MTATEIPGKKVRARWYDVAIFLAVVTFFAALTIVGLCSVMMIDRRSPTTNAITQIQVAIEAYNTEYGEMPDATNNARLIKSLSGDNLRKIQFIALKPTQLSANGQLLDEWGTPLRISIDANSKIHAVSAGPDGTFGTPDDLSNQ